MPQKIRVLIIEDNEDERLYMKDGFNASGLYDVVAESDNGDEVNRFFKSMSAPELVISDLNMPGRNGYEVIMDIKTNSNLSHIPVVILSSAPLRPFAERCKKLGACAYFTKPDTFLEYQNFAKQIYSSLMTDCMARKAAD